MREVIVCESPKIIMIHGDCMEYMATLEPKAFELAIVDPPYGIGERLQEGGGKLKNTPMRVLYRASTRWDEAPSNTYFESLATVTCNRIIWGGNYFELPPTRCVICWDKVQYMHTLSAIEIAWTSFDKPAKIYRGSSMDLSRFHPTQKPVKLYKWLLKNYAKPGDRILDTHGGSFSSAIACYQMGFDFVGIEKDEEYFEKALRRVELAVSQGHFLTEE